MADDKKLSDLKELLFKSIDAIQSSKDSGTVKLEGDKAVSVVHVAETLLKVYELQLQISASNKTA